MLPNDFAKVTQFVSIKVYPSINQTDKFRLIFILPFKYNDNYSMKNDKVSNGFYQLLRFRTSKTNLVCRNP
jgi:hypothetical protein